MQIFSALNMTPVQRLKDEWKALPKKALQMYADLQATFEVHQTTFQESIEQDA